jgi:hypothetical protein
MASRVYGHERFLNQIFGFFRPTPSSNQLVPIIPTQMPAESRQQSAIRGGIALKARDHQGPQRSLFGIFSFH